jgi:hypothetical protein
VKQLLFVLVLLAVTAAPATAQIYSWRDALGALVVSNHPREDNGEMTTHEARRAATVSAAQPVPTRHRRGQEFDDVIAEHARAQGVSPELVRAVIQVESGFNSLALSPKGAMGLMQLMPATARELGVLSPFHPGENIRGGVTYLRQLLTLYDGNVELALAAYNAGPGSVAKYKAIPPYRETRAYVKRVTAASGPPPPPALPPLPPATIIYRWIETVRGKATTRYSNKPPQDVGAEAVGRR